MGPRLLFICLFIFSISYSQKESYPYIIVLGTIQDAGSPHMGCEKSCCISLFKNPDPNRKVVSLGLVDPLEKKYWLIEASPDFITQCRDLKTISKFEHAKSPDGIFLTHAHIGHYTGLMYLGKESYNSRDVPVFAMTRMKGFLIKNGPWSQLFKINNIKINNINHQEEIKLSNNLSITPFLVPHRDEFSETVGFKINGPKKSILFIPDIDKWGKWNKNLIQEIKKADLALLDGTFYDSKELNNRNISEIPHPFIIETMDLFKEENNYEKSKINFIHLNHTNPLLDTSSAAFKKVKESGFNTAQYKDIINL
ncbi:MBL fold metallo-hydrolase [Bacteroidota bacterium]|nr:MBL fold metallo-hydrolase [Bacteroidota bacterium]